MAATLRPLVLIRDGHDMTPHAQFFLATCIALIVTLPPIVAVARARLPYRNIIMVLFVGGYSLIGATFVLDSLFNPPLFVHGFVPGIGMSLIGASLGLRYSAHNHTRAATIPR